jgi:TRAP-type C4-dicarboxylate transport system permease small subunit
MQTQRPDGPHNNALVRVTQLTVTAAAAVAGAVLVALMCLTVADVVGRYFFNSPISGVFDLTQFSVLIMTFLSFAYCGFRGAHVVIELLYDRIPEGAQFAVRRLSNAVGTVLFAVIAWRAVVQSFDVREFNETSQLLTIPYWPFYYVVAFGAALFAIVLAIKTFTDLPEEGEG